MLVDISSRVVPVNEFASDDASVNPPSKRSNSATSLKYSSPPTGIGVGVGVGVAVGVGVGVAAEGGSYMTTGPA